MSRNLADAVHCISDPWDNKWFANSGIFPRWFGKKKRNYISRNLFFIIVIKMHS